MDLSLISKKIKERIEAEGLTSKTGDTVQYVDVNDLSQFVPMPDWFKELTTLPGVPFKFIVEFAGPPDSGKTTAGMIALINAQKAGVYTILVDAERKFAHKRFKQMGGDPALLTVIDRPSIEEMADEVESHLKIINDVDPNVKVLVVYDSIAVGVTKAELEKKMVNNATIADQAKVVKRFVRRILYYLQTCNTSLILINQMYKDVNPAAHGGSKISGGQGVEYGKSLSISFRRKKELTNTKQGVLYKTGVLTVLETKKNHLLDGDMAVKQLDVEVRAYTMESVSAKKSKVKKTDDIDEEDVIDLEDD